MKEQHQIVLESAREKLKELFETQQEMEEFATLGFILGISPEIRKHLYSSFAYNNLQAAVEHAKKIRMRVERPNLPTIHENTVIESHI